LLSCLPCLSCLSVSLCCTHPVRLGVASLLSPSLLILDLASLCLVDSPPCSTSYNNHHHRRLSPSALPPTKSRGRIPPPSHPASAQHASIRRNRPSILDPLSAFCSASPCRPLTTTDRRSGHNLNSPSHPFRTGARLFCLHPRTAVCSALSLPASRHPVVHSTSLPRPPPLLLLAAARTPHSPVSR
jgi:hypothetical protein